MISESSPTPLLLEKVDKKTGTPRQKLYFRTYAPCEDSDQPAHPRRLIWVFAVRPINIQDSKAYTGGQQRLWSDCLDVQADLSLRWAHMSKGTFSLIAVHPSYEGATCLIDALYLSYATTLIGLRGCTDSSVSTVLNYAIKNILSELVNLSGK